MEEVIDQAIVLMSGILILINARICLDLSLTLWKKYELDIVWLAFMFGSFVLVGAGGLIAVNVLTVPLTFRVLAVATLILAVLGTYNTLQGLNK